MVGKRHVAVLALERVAAVLADYGMRIAASVEENYCLVAAFQRVLELLAKSGRKRGVVAAPYLPAHIGYGYVRERSAVYSLRERYEIIFARNRPRIRFHRRGGAAEYELAAVAPCAHFRHLYGRVAGRRFGKIRGIVLLVNYYRAYVFQRGKYCAARADCYARLARSQPPPLVETLARGKAAVQYCRLFAETAFEL